MQTKNIVTIPTNKQGVFKFANQNVRIIPKTGIIKYHNKEGNLNLYIYNAELVIAFNNLERLIKIKTSGEARILLSDTLSGLHFIISATGNERVTKESDKLEFYENKLFNGLLSTPYDLRTRTAILNERLATSPEIKKFLPQGISTPPIQVEFRGVWDIPNRPWFNIKEWEITEEHKYNSLP